MQLIMTKNATNCFEQPRKYFLKFSCMQLALLKNINIMVDIEFFQNRQTSFKNGRHIGLYVT